MKEFLELTLRYHNTPVVDDDFPEMKYKFERAFFKLYEDLPKIVCLCGSTRFYELFQKVNYEETMKGNIVLSVGFYPHSSEVAHGEKLGCDDAQKIALDELHKRKIDLADEIYVLNVGGYIGESTRSEIEYAKVTGKTIRYFEEFDDEIEVVDGSDVDRVVNELKSRGGADAILGGFLQNKVAEYYATVDPVSCVAD